jgi:hypothetical protein
MEQFVTGRFQDGNTYTVEQAAQHAIAWCGKYPAWVRICDMPAGYCESLYVQWTDLSATQQRRWESELAYNEWATKRRKVPAGVISGKGKFYEHICDVPVGHNSMMVFRVGVKAAHEIRVQIAARAA